MENTKLTLNSKAVESVGIVNVYPNVLAQSLPKDSENQETYSAEVEFVTSKGADDPVAENMFTVTNCIEESGEVKISFKDPQSLKKNHTVYLKVTQAIPGYGNKESSPIKVTISDKCALPTVSGKTTVNYNKAMAYTKAYAEVLVTTSEPLKTVSDLSTVLRLKESTVPVTIAANGIEKISDTQYRVKLMLTEEITETDYKNAKQFNVQFEALCKGYRDTEFCQSKQIKVPVVSVAPTVVISTDVAMFYKETDMEFRNMKIDVDVPEDLTVKNITLTKDALKQFEIIECDVQSGNSFVVTVRPNAKSSGGNIQFNVETKEYGTLTSTKLKVTGRSITAEAISLFDESTKQKAASSYTFYYSLLGKERIELKAESQYLSEIVNNYGGDIEIDVQPANTATATLLNKKAVVISTEGDKVVITATKDAFDPKLKSNTSCKLKIALKALDGTNVKNTKAQNITITFSPKSYNTTVALKAAANLNMAAKEPVVSVKPTIKYLPMGAKVERVTFKNTADEQKFAIIPGENGAFELGLAADGVEVPSGKNTIALTYDIRTVSGELTRIDTSVVVNVTQNAAIKLSTSNITLYNSVIGPEFAKTIEFTESKFGGKISVEIDEVSREMLKDAGIRIVEEGKDSDYEGASDMKENVKYKVYVAEDLNRGQEKTYTVKAKVSLYNSATKKGDPITYNTSFKVKLAK